MKNKNLEDLKKYCYSYIEKKLWNKTRLYKKNKNNKKWFIYIWT